MAEKKDELAEIVGMENVSDEPEVLESYSRDHSFVPSRRPRLVVRPQSSDEVQKLVRWANRANTTLVPVSSGPPHFNGDTVPGTGGAVIVDLSRMNRIIRIDRRSRMIMIEPGVTYAQLQPELQRNDLKLSSPWLPRGNKSIIASLLERQPITVPKYQWVLLDPLKCLEVIWGNGEKIWTGDAGEYGQSLEEQWQRGLAQTIPLGPAQMDYYRLVSAAQGSMGIVTWASIKCEILPRIHNFYFVPARSLKELIDCVYMITRIRFGDEMLILNGMHLAAILGENPAQILALREELPSWAVIIGIAGRDILPAERVKYQENDIRNIVQQQGLNLLSAVPGVEFKKIRAVMQGPAPEPYWKLGYKGGCQDIFFVTTLDRTPQFVESLHSLAAAQGYSPFEIGTYIQPLQQGVSCHCEFNLPYNPQDPQEVARVQQLFAEASQALFREGAFFSRPYGIWADMVYSRDSGTTTLLRKVKGIFDPNNVLNTGKLCF